MRKIQLELVVIISNRGTASKVLSTISSLVTFPSIIQGRGTARTEFLSALGVGEPEKDMIICFAENKNVGHIYNFLENEMSFTKKKLGIAMSIPVSAIGGNLTLQILLGKTKDLI